MSEERDYVAPSDAQLRRLRDRASGIQRLMIQVVEDGVSWSDATAHWSPIEGWY